MLTGNKTDSANNWLPFVGYRKIISTNCSIGEELKEEAQSAEDLTGIQIFVMALIIARKGFMRQV